MLITIQFNKLFCNLVKGNEDRNIIKKRIGRRGILFAHKTKAKILNDAKEDCALNCFMYVHQNSLIAKLVDKIEYWKFSFFPDYIEKRNGLLVNIQLGMDIFHLNQKEIYKLIYLLIHDNLNEDFIYNLLNIKQITLNNHAPSGFKLLCA